MANESLREKEREKLREFKPHDYQADGVKKIIDNKSLALWWEPGLGKTVTTLTAIKELMINRWQISRVLIIAPLKVAESTWQDELNEWEHLNGVFSVATILGTAKERGKAVESGAMISVINRDNIEWLVNYVTPQRWPYDMVVIDEATSFKNPSRKRFKALRKVRGRITRVVELTGTPSSQGLGDLWAPLWLIDEGLRLERTVTAFRTRYFDYNPWTHQRTMKAGADKIILSKIKDVCFSLTASDWLKLPEFIEDDVNVNLTEKQMKDYKQFAKTFVLSLSDSELLTAATSGVLSNKLLQFASGAVYDEDGTVHDLHDEKLKALSEILESADEPVLLFYNFKFDLDRITNLLNTTAKSKRYAVYRSEQDLRAWNAGELDVLLAHPVSCGYGLNLQKGGRRIVWYTLPWSHEVYRQANARLYRQGQTKPVIVQRLVSKGTYDEAVRTALETKQGTHDHVMNYVRTILKGGE